MNGKQAKRLRRAAEVESNGSKDYQVRAVGFETIHHRAIGAIDWGFDVPLRVITAVQRRNNPASARAVYQRSKP